MKVRKHHNYHLMKGVSDSLYLAFVSILSIGGAFYIYNDINANNTNSSIASEPAAKDTNNQDLLESLLKHQSADKKAIEQNNIAESTIEKAPKTEIQANLVAPQAETINRTDEIKTEAKIETTKEKVVETTTPPSKPALLVVEKSSEQTEKTVLIEKKSPELVKESVTMPIAKAEDKKPEPGLQQQATAAEAEIATQENSSNAVTQEPASMDHSMPIHRMPVPQAQHPMMYQAQRYMPQPFMQAPYYLGNGNYQNRNINTNNQPYPQQANFQQLNFQQQRGQYYTQQQRPQQFEQQRRAYPNQNRPYPEQYEYAPWNPGRFY
ncbi:MAG: hypothetical protein QM479_05465 [Pseudomonadota bacterium]